MMKSGICRVVVLVGFLVGLQNWCLADVVEDANAGLDARRAKDYETAIRKLQPLWDSGAFKNSVQNRGLIQRALYESYVNYANQLRQDSSNSNRVEEALSCYKNAILVDDKRPEAYRIRGSFFCRTGQWEEAISDCRSAVKCGSTNHYIWTGLAACYLQMKDWDQANQNFEKALLMAAPKDRLSILRLAAENFVKKKRFEEAAAWDERILKLDSTSKSALGRRATRYKKEKKYELAAKDYLTLLSLIPPDDEMADSYRLFAIHCLWDSGQRAEALLLGYRGVMSPEHPFSFRAFIPGTSSQMSDEELDHLEQELSSNYDRTDPAVQISLVWVDIKKKDYESALKRLAEALEHTKTPDYIFYYTGVVYARMEDWDQSLYFMSKVGPSSPAFRLVKAGQCSVAKKLWKSGEKVRAFSLLYRGLPEYSGALNLPNVADENLDDPVFQQELAAVGRELQRFKDQTDSDVKLAVRWVSELEAMSKICAYAKRKGVGDVNRSLSHMVVVIDTSGSMQGSGIDQAKSSCLSLIELFNKYSAHTKSSPGACGRVGVVRFSSEAEVVVPCDKQFSKDEIRHLIGALEANGGTDLDGGLACALNTCMDLPEGTCPFVVLLADGQAELESYAPEGFALCRIPVFAVGLGDQVDEEQLQELAQQTAGTYLQADVSNLAQVFSGIWAKLDRRKTLVDCVGTLREGESSSVAPRTLAAADNSIIHLTWPKGMPALYMTSPEADRVVTIDEGSDHFLAMINPSVVAKLPLQIVRRQTDGELPLSEYKLTVFAQDPSGFFISPLSMQYKAGDVVRFDCSLSADSSDPVIAVILPNGEVRTAVRLDDELSSGMCRYTFSDTQEIGFYNVAVKINRQTVAEMSFRVGSLSEAICKADAFAGRKRMTQSVIAASSSVGILTVIGCVFFFFKRRGK